MAIATKIKTNTPTHSSFLPEDFKNQEVEWSTNDDKVLKVDSKTGSVEAIAEEVVANFYYFLKYDLKLCNI